MDITKVNHSGVQGMLANIYNVQNQPQNVNSKESEQKPNGVDSINNTDRSVQSLQSADITRRIEDRFSPSQELQRRVKSVESLREVLAVKVLLIGYLPYLESRG